ncbi:MAG: hypothetical protein HOV81_03845 [Kofleriaceae bacterium]|nr:hypothetical protein [Kofleriaceae bacterium]
MTDRSGLGAPHFDESGQPCARHGVVATDTLLALAAVGARVSGFHHDVASKLQSLMMSLDEITEIAEGDLRMVAETAQGSLRELHNLVMVNRALTKAPVRKRTPLRELATMAAGRAGMKLRGEVPAVDVNVAAPSITHALAIVFDLVSGPVSGTRTADIVHRTEGGRVVLELTGSETPSQQANELLVVASFLLRREEGALSCKSNGFVVALPLA